MGGGGYHLMCPLMWFDPASQEFQVSAGIDLIPGMLRN